jgi:hypothetical protein
MGLEQINARRVKNIEVKASEYDTKTKRKKNIRSIA